MHWLDQVLGLAALLLGAWLSKRIVTPKDGERASLLAEIARGAAALVVSLYPKASWAELLEQTVNQIAAAAGVPTRNAAAIQRAAAEALARLGKLPNG